MNAKLVKLVTMITIAIVLVSISTSVLALTPSDLKGTDPTTSDIQTFGNKIIGIIRTVGIVVAVVILMILGLKYMLGSAEEKAEYKKTMIPYVIGAILLFAASTIANVVYNFASGV